MPPKTFYESLFESFCAAVASPDVVKTSEITKRIKSFFRQHFQAPHVVLCSHEAGNEYMVDVLVTSFDPKRMIDKGSFEVIPGKIGAFLAMESELGGVSASSAFGVMRNVVEDFLKLLLVRAEHRVMIFTSIPYSGETQHVERRVEVLRGLYSRSPGLDSGVLLIHLPGTQPRSTQVQASIFPNVMRGFVVSPDGSSATEINGP